MMCDSWWQLQRQICVLAIQTMKSRYFKINYFQSLDWTEKFDWSFHGMKSEGWASFSCGQGRAGPPVHTAVVLTGRHFRWWSHYYAVLSQLRHGPVQCWPHNYMSPSVSKHNHAAVIHFTMQLCSSLSCSAILHLPSVQGLQGEMQWTVIISPTLYLPNNNMSPAVPQWCSSRLSTSRCVPLSAAGQVYLGPGSGLQRPPLSTIITSACSGVPAWQQSSASALQHSALGLGHGMMKVRVSAVVSVVVWQLQLFLALNYTFDYKVNDCQISE